MLFLQDFDLVFLATPRSQMGPADALSCKDEVDTSNDNQDVVLLPQLCLSKPSILPLLTKLPSSPHLTHLFLLHSMHWMMGNCSLPGHPNMTGIMMMGNSTLRTDCTSLRLLDKISYCPSMPARPADMAEYFVPSTYFNRTFGGQG